MHFILPKKRPDLHSQGLSALPLFFLAGPIQGAGDWHVRMSELLADSAGNSIVVNPSRYDGRHEHYRHQLDGPEVDIRQTDWERHYLRQAAIDWHAGCIIFWLAEQVGPRTDGRPYASDTRGELGEWRGHMMHVRNARVVVGAEKDFPGLSVIERNFQLALGASFRISDTMEEVAARAAVHAQQSLPLVGRDY
ncbi:MAG TPA: hypothetical protein VGB97_00340 [Candidatus Paceibacterota bacterium]|jgi:hypothetical protein